MAIIHSVAITNSRKGSPRLSKPCTTSNHSCSKRLPALISRVPSMEKTIPTAISSISTQPRSAPAVPTRSSTSTLRFKSATRPTRREADTLPPTPSMLLWSRCAVFAYAVCLSLTDGQIDLWLLLVHLQVNQTLRCRYPALYLGGSRNVKHLFPDQIIL